MFLNKVVQYCQFSFTTFDIKFTSLHHNDYSNNKILVASFQDLLKNLRTNQFIHSIKIDRFRSISMQEPIC